MRNWIGKAILGAALITAFAGGYLIRDPGEAIPRGEIDHRAPLSALDPKPAAFSSEAQQILRSKSDDFPALWERFAESSDARHLLVARWIDTDLESAKAYFAAPENRPIGVFFEEFALADAPAALAFAQTLPEGRSESARYIILRTLAAHNPASVAAELIRTPEIFRSMRDTIGVLIRADPSLAPQLMAAVPQARDLPEIIGHWAAVDPAAAFAWASEIEAPESRDASMRAVIEKMAIVDPQAAGKAIGELDFNDVHSRKRYLESIAEKIGDAIGGRTAAEWVLEHAPEETRRDILFGMMSGSSRTALEMLDVIPAGKTRDNLVSRIWMNWRDPNVAPALAWIDKNVAEKDRGDVYASLAGGLGARDFNAAQRALDALPDSAAKEKFESQLLIGHAQNDGGLSDREAGEDALKLILERYDERKAHQILLNSFPSIAGLNEAAAELFLQELPIELRNAHPSYLMASVWSKLDATEAMGWAAALPAGEGRDDALYGLARNLPDDEATAAWFNELPPSPGRDKVAIAMVWKSKAEDPARAFGWAQSLGADGERQQRMNEIVRQWSNQNQAAASEGIASADISEREKNALQLRLQNPISLGK